MKITAISNDAGATEYLAYLIKANNNTSTIQWNIFALDNSPAYQIFTRLNLPFQILQKKEELYIDKNSDIILYGTGWQVDFNQIVKDICKKYTIKSIGLIDHWTSYPQRFIAHALPDFIMVMDDKAYHLAQTTFKDNTHILQNKNYFLEYIQHTFSSLKKNLSFTVFISEPTSTIAQNNFQDQNAYGFTEYSVVKTLINKFDNLIIRLHPADKEDKYNSIIEENPNKNIQVIKPYEEELIHTLSKSKLTVGFDGMALYISYILGLNTVAFMPNSKRDLTIPLPKKYLISDIKNLDDITFDVTYSNLLQQGAKNFDEILKGLLDV